MDDTMKIYVEQNLNRFLDELFGLIRIPSISSQSEHRNDMYRAAEYWKKILTDAGADRAMVMKTEEHPVTFAEKVIGENLPTVLVYAHMDVMPVDPVALWESSPFEPVIRNGKIFARGADDDKGQSFIHAKAFEYMVKTNSLPCNVKFLIEGEEEIGSPHLANFCQNNKELLKSDVIIASDTPLVSKEIPSITTGLRGLSYWQVELTGPNNDLHSGMFGGAVANPVTILCKMIASCFDKENHIKIPGFYDKVAKISDAEKALINSGPFDKEAYKKAIGVEKLYGEMGYTTLERTGIRPSFDVCGIWGGYTGEGTKTIIPSKAYAKISARLVANQDHQEIAQLFEWYFRSICPKSISIKVEYLHGGQPYLCPVNHPAYIAAEKAYFETFGRKPIPTRSGGSIPIIPAMEEILGAKTILMGFGLQSDAIHSPNENFPLENFIKGIETIPLFYKYYANHGQ